MAARTPHKDSGVPLEEQLRNVQRERDELAIEVRQLTRLQDTSSNGMWAQIGAIARELHRAEEQIVSLQNQNAEIQVVNERLQEKYESLRERVPALELQIDRDAILSRALREELRRAGDNSFDLLRANERLQTERDCCRRDLETQQLEVTQRIAEMTCAHKAELASAREAAAAAAAAAAILQALPPPPPPVSEPALPAISAEEYEAEICGLRRRLQESEGQRRQLLNQVQELRGNVRVMVRLRPMLANDNNDADCLLCHPDERSLQFTGPSRGAGQVFTLDRVFGGASTQTGVFAEVEDLVQSSLDGYKVCILSYGQTGSGKTHTMSGGAGDSRGIVPRSIERLARSAADMRGDGWQVSATVAILELYNESFRDLLCGDVAAAGGEKVKVALIGDRVAISGLSSESLDLSGVETGVAHFHRVLQRASASRTVASTALNEQSSRSHMVFIVDVVCRHPGTGNTYMGGLRFVDLAGSERLDRTGTGSDAVRLRETVNINKSLSCLADVFSAIGSKQSHVPFRNSKLTMLLQDCLSGEGKALLVVNVSPTLASSGETLCSLRFASQVNRVELGKAAKSCFLSAPAAPPLVALPVNVLTPLTTATTSEGTGYRADRQPQKVAIPGISERSRGPKRQLAAIEEEAEVENVRQSSVLAPAAGGAVATRSSVLRTQQQMQVSRRVSVAPAAAGNTFLTNNHLPLYSSSLSRESIAPHSFLSSNKPGAGDAFVGSSYPEKKRYRESKAPASITSVTNNGGWR